MSEEQNIDDDLQMENNCGEQPTVNNEALFHADTKQGGGSLPTEQESEISNNKLEIKNMEVHHHPHVEKKSFKEYLLEGLMIFLAVTMGFFAEGIRENITKHEREHHLMELLVQDLKKDIIHLDTARNRSKFKLAYLDTLRKSVIAAIDNELPDSIYKMMYAIEARFGNSGIAYRFVPTDRALSQLEKTDAYNFISKQNVSDSILHYKENNTTLIDQYQIIREYYQIKSHEVAQQIFKSSVVDDLIAATGNTNIYASNIYVGTFYTRILKSNKKFSLLTRDKNILELYCSKLRDNSSFFGFYTNTLLPIQKARAERLIALIEKEYHLKKE